jgi:hypothetical protein
VEELQKQQELSPKQDEVQALQELIQKENKVQILVLVRINGS